MGCRHWTCVPRACGVDLLLSLGRDLLLFLDLRGQNLGGVQDCTVGGSHKAVTITKEQRRTWSFKRMNTDAQDECTETAQCMSEGGVSMYP